jgi:hypothetical protein
MRVDAAGERIYTFPEEFAFLVAVDGSEIKMPSLTASKIARNRSSVSKRVDIWLGPSLFMGQNL